MILLSPFLMTRSLHAVAYTFEENKPAYIKDNTAMKVGTRLYLFHSGTLDVKRTIHVNDILSVFREYPSGFSSVSGETGKIRILSCSGKYFYEAEVVEGAIQPGDMAKKGTVACFVTPFGKNMHSQ